MTAGFEIVLGDAVEEAVEMRVVVTVRGKEVDREGEPGSIAVGPEDGNEEPA